ncbi:MAG: endonuclease domain-containing protein [Candidatus Shapirobacteria bacterium]|nr:endonuclease domain-containing protein [Candidatus Shapirobacteria bacterium]
MYYKYLIDENGRSKNGNLKYLEDLRKLARNNRNNPTEAERIFWSKVLQYDKIKYRFLRQKPIGRFILDFYCSKLLLAIEIDGDSHDTKKYLDNERDLFLKKYSIKTIRYTNGQVLNELNKIKSDLENKIKEREKIIFVPLWSKGKTSRSCGTKGI